MVYALFEVRAACFIFNNKGEILLLKNNLGTWGLLGGHLENGEQITDTVHREAMEEAGIMVEIVKQIDSEVRDNSFISGFACKYKSGKIKLQESEVFDYRWVKLSELKNLKLTFDKLPTFAKEAHHAIFR